MGGFILAVLAAALPATAAADGFVEIAGGLVRPTGDDVWARLADSSPKLALRAGSMNRRWSNPVVSVDWTSIWTDEPSLSAHRFRAIASSMFHRRFGVVNACARAGIGFDFLRLESSATEVLTGYAFEAAVGLWFDAGPVEIGGDVAIATGLNGNATVGGLRIDVYHSVDVDVLVGVRFVSQ